MSITEPETVLVTGATGNVGRPLVRELLAAGHRVRALTRNPAAADLPPGAEAVAGDLTDPDSLAAAFDGVTAVHLITFDGATYAPLDTGPRIVDLADRAGGRRVTVLAGAVEKGPLEHAVEAGSAAWTRLAPVEFMSNTLAWAASIREEGAVREPFPEIRSALVHDADIAAVAAIALTTDGHGGREYALTGPEALTMPERVAILAAAIGREVRYVERTREEAVALWEAEGYSADDIAFFLAMRTDPPEAGYTVLPTVERVTGRPARTFAQWARENAAAFAA
jgi:uncharacterized protein YbjT (DUF2867 family)